QRAGPADSARPLLRDPLRCFARRRRKETSHFHFAGASEASRRLWLEGRTTDRNRPRVHTSALGSRLQGAPRTMADPAVRSARLLIAALRPVAGSSSGQRRDLIRVQCPAKYAEFIHVPLKMGIAGTWPVVDPVALRAERAQVSRDRAA